VVKVNVGEGDVQGKTNFRMAVAEDCTFFLFISLTILFTIFYWGWGGVGVGRIRTEFETPVLGAEYPCTPLL